MQLSQQKLKSLEIPLGTCKIKVLPLERIIKSKESLKRQKDLLALPVLKDALATVRNLSRKNR